MTGSRRKTPIVGITSATSDKRFKQAEHGRARAALRAAIAHDTEPPHCKTFGDPWLSEKDGKAYVPDHPDLLRK